MAEIIHLSGTVHAGSVVDLVSLLQIHAILPSWQVLHADTCTSGTPISANALLKIIILIEKTLESAAGKANVFSILYSRRNNPIHFWIMYHMHVHLSLWFNTVSMWLKYNAILT